MNLTVAEATTFAQASLPLTQRAKSKGVLLGVAPTYLALKAVKEINPHLIIAAQNMHFENQGAFTGEISAPMLKSIGIDWVIIGHSERRTYFAESSLSCNKKILKALGEGMTVVYCVGETSDDYDHGRTKAVVRDQLLIGLAGVKKEHAQRVIIAYEPIWSIGTGKNASKEHAQDLAAFIRERIEETFDGETSQAMMILYGGSVKPSNVKDYLLQPDVDGALVGGASLQLASFEELLTNMLP